MTKERVITVLSIIGIILIWWWFFQNHKAIPNKIFTDQKKTFSFIYPKDFNVINGGVGYMKDGMAVPSMVLAIVDVPKEIEPNVVALAF